jgi:hypothetical protein
MAQAHLLDRGSEDPSFDYLGEASIPGTNGGNIRDYIFKTEGPMIKYVGSPANDYSCARLERGITPAAHAHFYRAKSLIKRTQAIECLGGKSWREKAGSAAPSENVFAPMQVVALIDDDGLVPYFYETLFFPIGHHKELPLFLKVAFDGAEAKSWQLSEAWFGDGDCEVAKGEIIALPQRFF